MRLAELMADRVLEEFDGDFHRDDSAITNVLADERAKLGSFAFLFFAQEVSSLFLNGGLDWVESGTHCVRTDLRDERIQSLQRCARTGYPCL